MVPRDSCVGLRLSIRLDHPQLLNPLISSDIAMGTGPLLGPRRTYSDQYDELAIGPASRLEALRTVTCSRSDNRVGEMKNASTRSAELVLKGALFVTHDYGPWSTYSIRYLCLVS